MCGIAGFITIGIPAERSLIRAMCDLIRHRGPDGEGEYIDGPVALGHRRLSIIDLEGGAQPLGNEDDSVMVTFNGEIYNFIELREDLEHKGHIFKTKSDTEVLVHLWEDVGERLPEYLNGMFAFAIWDRRKQLLFAARDRFGEKPFYYATDFGAYRFVFASELKAVAALPGFPKQINPRAVADFLALSYVPDPDTIYASARKLPAGHCLTWSAGRLQVRPYWKPEFRSDPAASMASAIDGVRDLLQDCVTRRTIADVPLGAFLSGGVDSSAMVACMAHAGSEVKTFSIGFSEKEFDELRYAHMMVARYRTQHRERVVTPLIHEALKMLFTHYDEPFADSSAIPTLYLSRMTREHVTVAMSGDGGDELFGGYRRYRFGVFEDRIRKFLPRSVRRRILGRLAELYPRAERWPRPLRAKSTLTELSQELGDSYFSAISTFRDAAFERVLASSLQRDLNGYSPRADFAGRFAQYSGLPPLKQMQAVDLETYLPGDILVKVDRASMAFSLETRAPFLDHRLANLICAMPSDFLLHGGTGKYVLKKALEPMVPAPIINRPKMGFGVPMDAWFRSSLKNPFQSIVLSDRMASLISITEARKIWEDHQSGRRNYGNELWHLLMLAGWVNVHLDGNPAAMAAIG